MSIIVLGVGHGGSDPGACNGRRREADDNLRLAKGVALQLRAQGHTVYLTRESDISMTVDQRRLYAINHKADLFIDLHRNSFSSSTANGIEIWIRNTAYSQSASDVLAELAKVEHQSIRGVKVGAYGVLYSMPMPAMLIELGFISNARDNELYDKHFEANAVAIAKGAVTALGGTWKDITTGQEQPRQLARIQFGAFTWPDNEKGMREVMALAKSKGFECFAVLPDTAKENER